jgi:hypothetical protein
MSTATPLEPKDGLGRQVQATQSQNLEEKLTSDLAAMGSHVSVWKGTENQKLRTLSYFFLTLSFQLLTSSPLFFFSIFFRSHAILSFHDLWSKRSKSLMTPLYSDHHFLLISKPGSGFLESPHADLISTFQAFA